MHTNWQVCSLVVQAKSERISDISTQLNAFPGCEVAVSDAPSGQLIVVVEAEDSETLIQTIESVRNVEGVLAVSLVYHQQEEQGLDPPETPFVVVLKKQPPWRPRRRLPVSACRALPAPLLVSRKPLNGIKRRAVSVVRVAAFWSERNRGVWWPVRATRMRRLTVA